MRPDLIIRGRRVVLPHVVAPAAIHITEGRIVSIESYDGPTLGCDVIDADDGQIVMPGMVDTHVHVNEPGRSDWEGFSTATTAAAAGGTTTLIDMPLNSIPATTSVSAFEKKLAAAKHKCFIDVGFWGGVVPGNKDQIDPLFHTGVVGFKCFLVPSGVDEFPHVTEEDLRLAITELARLGALLIVHAELPDTSGETTPNDGADPTRYDTFLATRPCADENRAIELMIKLSREFATRVHIVHLSSAEALPMLRQARQEGVMISAESCPHYLYFASEDIPSGATEFKCCPPIRGRNNREQLWQGLNDGTIEAIVSDHSPCPASMKSHERGDFLQAWGGISSLELRLPVIWTEAGRRGYSILDLTRWLCSEPATLVGLGKRKGAIHVGYDADIIIWDPEREFRVSSAGLHHRHKFSPYVGESFLGLVQKTFLRGQKIYDGGVLCSNPSGQFLLDR